MNSFTLTGNIIDVVKGAIFPGTIEVKNGTIEAVYPSEITSDNYIAPGFVDAHVHIESSMLVPSEFARLAVTHGTVATVSDPHEIANVLGLQGIEFMIKNGLTIPFKFYFGAPSCVPATPFETSGASISATDIQNLLSRPEIKYLAEMMNFPGVIFDAPDVIAKLKAAKAANKPIDGHAPGLTSKDLKKYITAGISTDHECFDLEEAREKIEQGMKILIREGSAAKNFQALIPLLNESPDMVMLCSDDKHANDLVAGHINLLVKRAISYQIDPIKVFRATSLNPKKHYNLNVGLLQQGDPADLIVFNNLTEIKVLETYINGEKVAENGKSLIQKSSAEKINNFQATPITPEELKVVACPGFLKVIEVIDGELITRTKLTTAKVQNDVVNSDVDTDILKLVVINRYVQQKPAIGFVHNFGLKRGAIAQSIAHDSHNIIAVGTNDADLTNAINLVITNKGGMGAASKEEEVSLPLPIAGIMTDEEGSKVAQKYEYLNHLAKTYGSHLTAPWMTLSFLALLVIPELKLGDRGLFDGVKFEFTNLWANSN